MSEQPKVFVCDPNSPLCATPGKLTSYNIAPHTTMGIIMKEHLKTLDPKYTYVFDHLGRILQPEDTAKKLMFYGDDFIQVHIKL